MTKRVTQLSIPSRSLRTATLDAVDNGEPDLLWANQFVCLNELQIIADTSADRDGR